MGISPKHQRSVVRWAHLVAGSGLGAVVYGPGEWVTTVRAPLQLVLFPVAAATGLWLWQGHRLRRWLAQSSPSLKEST